MKKVLFAAMLILSSLSCSAQDKKYPYYCTINGSMNLALKIRIELEWGESKKLVYLRDDAGKKIEFNNLTDIVNYMSKRGWEFVTIATYNNVIHYVMKKYVSSPDEAKDGLRFDTDK